MPAQTPQLFLQIGHHQQEKNLQGRGDSNEVGEKGCRHLSKAAWGELEVIDLCNCTLTQLGTKSETGAAGISAGEAGRERKEMA